MTEIDEIFNNSYERCLQSPHFFDRFYENYVSANELVAEKFADTDMDRQKDMLKASLHMLMALRSTNPKDAVSYFRRIGKIHGRDKHDIPPEMYDLWLSCLLQTVEESDHRYDARVEAAWRTLLEGGIRIMQSAY